MPAKARVQRYPLAVKNKWVFVWMGEPAQADLALLPDNFSCDHPDWDYLPGYLHYSTPQQLICDNLLDFSHLSYVHEKTLGGTTAIAQARAEIEPVPRGIRVTRKVHDVPPPPYYRAVRQLPGNLDRWFVYDFLLPGTLLMHSGGRPVADPEGDMSRAVRLHSCQTVTPETETSTHYFFQQSRRVDEGDHSIAEALYKALLVAFEEDRAMITAQSQTIDADPDATDAAAGDGRRGAALSQARGRDDRRRARGPSGDASDGAGRARRPLDRLTGEHLGRDRALERRARQARDLVVHVLVDLGGRRMGAEDRLERGLGQRRAKDRLELAHQRPVLIGADGGAAHLDPLEQARQGDHGFEAGLQGFEVGRSHGRCPIRPCSGRAISAK